MNLQFIEQHYIDNRRTLVKRFTRRAGSEQEAEDVIQDGYERAIKYFERYNPEYDFDPWLGRILRTALFDYLDYKRGLVFEELNVHRFEAEPEYITSDYQFFIEDMMEKEKEDIRPILELHFLKGYSPKEIYEFNSFSYPNTRKIIQRFRDKLKDEYLRREESPV